MSIVPAKSSLSGGKKIHFNVGIYESNENEEFYLVFLGSNIRHVIPAKPRWNYTNLLLEGLIPSHSKEEVVEVSAYRCIRDTGEAIPVGLPALFYYGSDIQFTDRLDNRFSQPCQIADADHSSSDLQADNEKRLSEAFRALPQPRCWNMLDANRNGAVQVENVSNISSRLEFDPFGLLSLPWSNDAFQIRGEQKPNDIANQLDYQHLSDFLRLYRQRNALSKAVPLVVSTNLSWSHRDIEYDISELERLKEVQNSRNFNDNESGDMKDYHLASNGGEEEKEPVENGGQEVSEKHAETTEPQERVLEENLRRLRGIHESIQKLRQQNTKQIVQHTGKTTSVRLSNSCPSLYLHNSLLDTEDVCFQSQSLFNMRTINRYRGLLSPNSKSLDSSLFETIDVKIRINDITPTVSQECILLPPHTGEDPLLPYGRSKPIAVTQQVSNIGGTASRRLAKKSAGKRGPVRRQSWSSLGANISHAPNGEEKKIQPRRWSLSSLDSDAEDTFADCYRDTSRDLSPSSPVSDSVVKGRLGSLGGSTEESSLSKSAKQSLSVPSMPDITTVDIKENLEPMKSNGNMSPTFFTGLRCNPLQKSLSTPAITVDEDETEQKAKQEIPNRQSMCIMHPAGSLDSKVPPSSAESDQPKNALFHHVSLAGVLRESQRHPATGDSDEEKPFSKRKKRSSIFFKKKPDKHKSKESKKTPHQFVMCQGNSFNCDVCHKSFVKKQALKCENCLVIVHDSSCKDQVIDCNKFKLQTAQAKPSMFPVSKEPVTTSSQIMNGLSPSDQNRNSFNSSMREKYNLPQFHGAQGSGGIPLLSEASSRSSFINLGKMISEERDNDTLEISPNIIDINSASMESLDDDAIDISDLEDNQVLRLTEEEPETWRATVDKKILKKLKEKEVKRQEAIYELILTEKHHCLNLQIMQKVYVQGMLKELNMSRETVERLFPYLSELLELHKAFLCRLRERQGENPVVEQIADILEEQFHDQRAEQMKIAYGQFCSQHIEALNMYKEWSKSDRKFQNFIKRCSSKRLCKTKGIPECLLLVTQRITKYNLIIKSLMKAAKDNEEELATLTKVFDYLTDITSQVDVQVAEKEKEMRLFEIYNKIDPKTQISYRNKKFKKNDFLADNRKLIREGTMTWISSKGKTIDVLAVMTTDLIFLLHESNQKYLYASLENKPGIVSIQKLLVRKKAGQNSGGMYLISSNPKEPEMIELHCRSPKDQKIWIESVREAVGQCPEEDEGLPCETEEYKKLDAARTARFQELIGLLHEKDLNIAHDCEVKMRIFVEMMEMIGVDTEQYENVNYSQLVETEIGPESKDFLSAAISNASRLANNLYASGTNLSRSFSSAGEHQSDNYISPLLPKRAETFGGFDNPTKEPVIAANKVPVLKKKLMHLKEHAEGMSFLPSKVKIDEDFELGESLEASLRGYDSRAKSSSRPSSIYGSPDKQQNRKNSVQSLSVSPQNSITSYREMCSEVAQLVATSLLMSQGKEQLVQIVELAHHLNNIKCSASHLFSNYESMKVQLIQVHGRLSTLAKEKEVRERRPLYRPEHQLEELRNLQKQLNHDKAVWQQEKTQHNADMKAQRAEIERIQEHLKKEQSDVNNQRELLYRKLDALQKQGIILSPTHTVLNNCITVEPETHKIDSRGASLSPDSAPNPSSDLPQHRRTFSCDLHHDSKDPYGNMSASSAHSRTDSKGRSSICVPSQPTSGKVVPLHLSSSATNLQKRPSISSQSIRQQLPLKLANNHATGSVGGMNGTQLGVQGPQQLLPFKLALGSLPSNIPTFLEETKGPTPKRSHSAASSPSSTLTAPVHVRGGSSPALVTYPPNTVNMSPNGTKSGNSVLHQLKLTSDKTKNKKGSQDEEIFC